MRDLEQSVPAHCVRPQQILVIEELKTTIKGSRSNLFLFEGGFIKERADGKAKMKGTEGLERALSGIFGAGKTTRKLSQVLAYGSSKGTISYQEIREIIKDDPEDILLMAEEWRLLLPVRTAKSSSWEDRLLLIKEGEVYEIPNIIRYLVREALQTPKWNPENAVIELFREFGDPDWEQIPGLVRSIAEKATDHKITGNQIKKICLQFGLNNRVDGLIAELKAAGIISPKLSSIPEVIREGSPIYELNPSVAIGLSP